MQFQRGPSERQSNKLLEDNGGLAGSRVVGSDLFDIE